jgi:hypothetical protein
MDDRDGPYHEWTLPDATPPHTPSAPNVFRAEEVMVTRSKPRRAPLAGVFLGTAAGVGLLAFTVPPIGPVGVAGLVLGALVGAVWGSILGSLDGLVASIRRDVQEPRAVQPGRTPCCAAPGSADT